ncbi:hemolysin [Companilactobacillus sp. RD055328]|uniref:hemolysin family protein n=1 Tax=Companilactobacillus sp. RD055328 TaxID=2916634 RepID=UPI001FC88DD5|nr:hemolysin family protein [Companilactobacillus sp. RD055328]GKQ43243.1 hemolysin [Companilactobacillus sp. RD055328]
MANSQLITNLIIILITFVLAFYFVAAEFALVTVRPSQIEDAIENGTGNKKKLNRILHMTHNLNEYLSTTQVGVSAVGIIIGWIGESTIETIFVDILGILHVRGGTSMHAVGSIIGVVILTYLEVVLTEIVPKNISIDMPLKMSLFVVTPLHVFHTIFYPFVWLLNISATGIVRMMGFKPANTDDQSFSQSEILRLSQTAVYSGELDQEDYDYMQRAFQFNDKVAKDVMVDRTRLYTIDINTTVAEAVKEYLQEGFSRIPVVADGDKDNILGYVYSYDLVRQNQVDGNISVSRVLKNIITVPETMPIQTILKKMIHRQMPFVMVVDEYGGTSGLITDDDIYEELFGPMYDENDDASDEYIYKDEQNQINVLGKTTLYDIERYFDVDIKEFEESDIITIGGFIMENYPETKDGSVVTIENLEFTVTEFDHAFPNQFTVVVLQQEIVKDATKKEEV